MSARNGTAVAPAPPRKDFLTMLDGSRGEIAKLLPDPKSVDRVIRIVRSAWQMNGDLQKCTGASILASAMQACELGLEPGGALKHAYLIPYKATCTLQVSYMGMLELARRSGAYGSIEARLVREGDDFALYYDPRPIFRHVPSLKTTGPTTHAYAYATLRTGELVLEVMTREEIEYTRAKSKAGPVWATWWDEMAKKTVIKRLLKRQPCSVELARAIEHDNADTDLSLPAPQRAQAGISRSEMLARQLAGPQPEPEFEEGTSGEIRTEADDPPGEIATRDAGSDYEEGVDC